MKKDFWKDFLDWAFLAEKEYNEKFEQKHRKGVNIWRIVGLILIVVLAPLLRLLIKVILDPKYYWKLPDILCPIICAIPLGILLYAFIILYRECIRGLWDFLKKEPIVHYIFLGIIPAVLLFLGFQHFVFTQKVLIPEGKVDIVERLTGFFSALFAAITVVAAIIALSAWRSFKEMKEKLETFKEFEDKVKFIKEKKDLADWAQEKFDKDDDKGMLSTISFELTEEEKAKLKKIEKSVLDDCTDDSWLKLIYAKQLMDVEENNNFSEEGDFVKVKNIFEYIEKRALLKEDSVIERRLYHLKGLMYWRWYKHKKSIFINKYLNKSEIPWSAKWWKKDTVKGEYKGIDLLKKSKEYYEKTLDTYKKKGDNNKDETLNNIAIVLIELSKFQKTKPKRKKHLDKAFGYLKDSIKEDYNTCWDKARVLYYIDSENNKNEIQELLQKAVEDIDTKKGKKFFLEMTELEREEKGIHFDRGFPGKENDEFFIELKKKLREKRLD
jgi:hypothetical protein